VDFEKSSNRISTSSSNDFESDLDSMPVFLIFYCSNKLTTFSFHLIIKEFTYR
jgi:hypothetical protein